MSKKAEAIVKVLETKVALDKAYSECEYDRGYWCHREIDAYNEACEQLEEAFK